MKGNLYKTTEQLVQMVNSSNEKNNPHFDYYKKILKSCNDDISFNQMLSSINFKGVQPLPKNKSMFRFIVKCSNYNLNQSGNASNNVIIGPVNPNSPLDPSDMYSLSIPMSHYHLSKNNYVQDNFIYRISNKENGAIAKFIERIRFVDNRIQMLICDYIKRVDSSSPISNLLFKNNVTSNSNWTYTGIINKIKDDEYINFRYFKDFSSKDTNHKDSKLGTHIYNGNERFIELEELLSRDTFCYVHGLIYPLIKVIYVLVNERTVNGMPLVNFTCKAYFVDIIYI
jgi:hypothetical protein